MGAARVTFQPGVRSNVADVGSTVLDAARAAGVVIDAPCGGIGRCGRCRVRVSGAVRPPADDELAVLSATDRRRGVRLACRTVIEGDVTVSEAAEQGSLRIVESATAPDPAVEPPEERGHVPRWPGEPLIGAAVDVGTTTIAARLYDLRSGELMGAASAPNPQASWGSDVLSRVSAALAGEAGALQRAVVSAIEALVTDTAAQAAVASEALREIVCVGNTAMTSLLLGADVSPLAAAPYEGARTGAETVPADALGFVAFPLAVVTTLPGVSAFIGSDITAGLLVTRPDRGDTPAVFVDLGTNGEIVLAADGTVYAASAAAGPALEGAGVEHGMRAETGAIERAWLEDGDLRTSTVGDAPPAGICGSGLIDLAEALLDGGALTADGLLRTDAAPPLGRRVFVRDDGIRAFAVDIDGDVTLTQRDVRAFQLAKGAVRTALDLLLERAGIPAEAIGSVIVAGGFGLHVRGAALARTGMVPAEWADRLAFAGNTALAGAVAALLANAPRVQAARIASAVETIDLAGDPRFQERFIAALGFPAA
ncbi:MAG: ASKHA domain-containing protein [Anaerosomatales bacterium]|nr:ASKHA domain-containing protein [Anaerosomatales bacterium]